MNILSHLSLLFSLTISCLLPFSWSSRPEPSAPQIFCERSFTNFAWGYVHQGIYVDHAGQLYSYEYQRGDRPWSPKQDDAPTRQELEEKYNHGRKLIRQLDAQEVQEKFSLVVPASKGQLSKRVQRGADQGATVCRCYLPAANADHYRVVELRVTGDWSYENLAPEAKRLIRWLESLRPSVP